MYTKSSVRNEDKILNKDVHVLTVENMQFNYIKAICIHTLCSKLVKIIYSFLLPSLFNGDNVDKLIFISHL